MNFLSHLLLVALITVNYSTGCSDETFRKYGIIPTFAEDIGNTNLKVVYKSHVEVRCGNLISFLKTLTPPNITCDVTKQCDTITLLFFGVPTNFYDPDALLGGAFLHWIVYNIPAEALAAGYTGKQGDTAAGYFPPVSPTYDHRYTFFIYCQSEDIKPDFETILGRIAFNVKKFARERNLGNPVAGNFFNLGVTGKGPDLSNIAPNGRAPV